MQLTFSKQVFAFICISLVFFLLNTFFAPILISVDFIENKYVYFVIKDVFYTFFIALFAFVFIRKLKLKIVAIWFLLPIVFYPILFSVLGLNLLFDGSDKPQLKLLASSAAYSFMYWPLAFGVFLVINRFLKIKHSVN